MAKTIHWFLAPDGTALKRTSDNNYTHAILVKRNERWVIGSCVSRPDLIAARIAAYDRAGNLEVIAVARLPEHPDEVIRVGPR